MFYIYIPAYLKAFVTCCHIEKSTNFRWKPPQYLFRRKYISKLNCNMAITVLTGPWSACSHEVLLYCHAMGTKGEIKMGSNSNPPKATLKCSLGGGTRSKQWPLECSMHFRKSLQLTLIFRAPLWHAKEWFRDTWAGASLVISQLETNVSCWHRLYYSGALF